MGSAKADSSRMPLMARLKPSLANCAAQPKPMPREPPVTKATGFEEVVIINEVRPTSRRKSRKNNQFEFCGFRVMLIQGSMLDVRA